MVSKQFLIILHVLFSEGYFYLPQYGYEFVARKPESVTISLFNCEEEDYQILNVIEFTSTRKRMSVIVRTPKGEIKIYVKVKKKPGVYILH